MVKKTFKQWWLAIPPMWTKLTIASHLKSLNTKKKGTKMWQDKTFWWDPKSRLLKTGSLTVIHIQTIKKQHRFAATHKDHSQRPHTKTTHKDHSQRPHTKTTHKDHSQRPLTKTTHKDHTQRPLTKATHKDHSQRPLTKATHKDHSQRPLTKTTHYHTKNDNIKYGQYNRRVS